MQNYMRTILSGLQNWINKRLHDTIPETDEKHQQLVTNIDGKTVWENKTHWIEHNSNVEMMPEITAVDDGDDGIVSTQTWTNNIVAGNTYTIIYNGVTYTSPAVDASTQLGLSGVTILGDAAVMGGQLTGGNPDAPFVIICVPNEQIATIGCSMLVRDKNNLTEITLSISGSATTIHKLDSKFIDWPDWYPEIIAEDANTYSGSVTSTQFGDNYSGTFDHFEPADRRIYAIRFNNSATTIDCVCEYYPGDMDLPAFYSFSNLIGQAMFQIQCYVDSAKKSAIISTFKVDEISFENPRQITFPIREAFVEGTLKGFRNGKDSNGRMNYSVCGIGANSTLGNASLAVGNYASASGSYSIAYGEYCQANGLSSAAFNNGKAKVSYAFAANSGTASGLRSASFNDSSAAGETSVSFNTSSASGKNQLTFGKHNIKDTESKYIMIAGNGSSTGSESNAATIAWDGTAWFKGDIKVGGTGQDDENATTLVTQAYVDSPKNYIALTDTVTGQLYHITIENGNLVSTLVEGGE